MKTRPAVIFDLDGTLALIDHRRYMIEGEKKNWKAFYLACVDDEPNKPVITAFNLFTTAGYETYIFSGRSDLVRGETDQWLHNHGISPNFLLMRKEGDFTPDHKLKEKWLFEAFNDLRQVYCVFDDRDKVVKMWREKGLMCFQVAPGDF